MALVNIRKLVSARTMVCLALVITLLLAGSVSALSPEQKKLFQSNILYFDYNAEECTVSGTNVANGNVVVIGDSLTVGMRDAGDLQKKLTDKGFSVSLIDGRVGRPLAGEGLAQIQADKDAIAGAGTVVVALGTNDASGSVDTFRTNVDKAIDDIRAINPNAKIYWVNFAGKMPNFKTAEFSAVLAEQATAKNFTVVDWASVGAQYIPDGDVHPGLNGGYPSMADLLANQLVLPTGGSISTAPLSEEANRGYNGEIIFNDAQMEAIRANQPFYEKAAQETGVPWQAIAVLHNRENGLKRENPANGQGAYQLYSYTNGGTNSNSFRPAGPISDEEFQRQTTLAAGIFKGISEGNNPANKPLEANNPAPNTVQDTFFGYNGRGPAYRQQAAALGYNPETQGYEGSPYVMNKVDAARDPNTAAPGTWGQYKSDGGALEYPANQDFGAWPQFSAIAGIASGGGGACGSSQIGGPVATKVVQIAEREYLAGADQNLQATGGDDKYIVGNKDEPWCADFVSWVFKEAGSPFTGGVGEGGWQIPSIYTMKAWFEQNGEYHSARSGYVPRVGDVAYYAEKLYPYPEHVNLVVAVNTDAKTFTTIGGNERDGIRKSEQPFDANYITGFGTKTK